MSGRLEGISDVVAWRLCIGCGACAAFSPEHVHLYDIPSEGIRPDTRNLPREVDRACLDVCPAYSARVSAVQAQGAKMNDFEAAWGPVLEIWEGHATNPDIRYRGSSGGALTAIGVYCLEQLGFEGVLHVAQNPSDPVRNRTQISRSRSEILAAAGSRYSPASVCDHLNQIVEAAGTFAVIGKPAEIVALRRFEAAKPKLATNVGVTLSFFCAESPATEGTLALLQRIGLDPNRVKSLRYRGFGWPGNFTTEEESAAEPHEHMSYQESWAFLQRFRPWATHIWPDGSGEAADISCGDPWYQQSDRQNPGSSLIVVRTERGRELIRGAIAAGYLQLTPAEPWKLSHSQDNLLKKKGAIWGRLLLMRLFGIPTGIFDQKALFRCWLGLSLKEKLQSTIGTAVRIATRKLNQRQRLDRAGAVEIPGSRDFSGEAHVSRVG